VCDADTRDHRRVAKDGWRDGEVVEESNSRAKKNRRDVELISSRRPAFRSSWMVSAPWTPTDFPAAAALAWFTALAMCAFLGGQGFSALSLVEDWSTLLRRGVGPCGPKGLQYRGRAVRD